MKPAPALLNHLAELLHNHYIKHRLDAGETPATNPVLMRFDKLPEHLQQSNRETAMQLWTRLQNFGFDLVPQHSMRPAIAEEELLAYTEVLSELGHACWMHNRQAQGWTYAPGPKDVEARTSPCFVPWEMLPPEEQDKEREQIRDLPGILNAVQLKIVRASHLVPRPDDLEGAEKDWAQAATLEDSAVGRTIEAIVMEPTPEMLEAVAKGLHDHYVKHRIENGEHLGENPSLRPWHRLEPALQYSNRNTAAQIWRRLETLGYAIATDDPGIQTVSKAEFAQFEESLSHLGHIAWMNERLAAGWVYAPGPKDIVKKTHSCLVSWEMLPESEREKERQQIRDIPDILQSAGLRIVVRPSRINALPDFTPIPDYTE